MVAYHRSVPGRVMAFASALPLLGGAIFPWNAPGAPLYALPIIGGIGLAFVASMLSLEEYPAKAVTAMLVLPLALFLYLPLVAFVVPVAHGVAYVMATAGCGLLAMTMRPAVPRPNRRAAHQRNTGAPPRSALS